MELVEKTYDIRGASELIGCKETKLRSLVRNGEIPYYRVGNRIRFTDVALSKWMFKQERMNSSFRA